MSANLSESLAAALKGEKPLELLDRAALLCMLMEDGPVVEGVGRLSTVQALALVAGIGEEAAAAGVEQAVSAGLLIRDEEEVGGIIPATPPPPAREMEDLRALVTELEAKVQHLADREAKWREGYLAFFPGGEDCADPAQALKDLAKRERELEEALAAVTPYAESRAEDLREQLDQAEDECDGSTPQHKQQEAVAQLQGLRESAEKAWKAVQAAQALVPAQLPSDFQAMQVELIAGRPVGGGSDGR